MSVLRRLDTLLLAVERTLLVLLFSLMIVLAFSQVLLRNIFSTGLLWADPLLRNGVLWLGFIGASLATRDDKHIRIDIASRFLKPGPALAASIATDLFTLGVCLALAEASWTFVLNEIEFRDTLVTIGEFPVPTWWSQVILPAGFLLVALRLALRVVRRIAGRAAAPTPGGGEAVPPGGERR